MFNRRFGVPLIDLGTIRLPRIVGHGRAMELILTGRPVGAEEALRIGLVNEVTEDGGALARAARARPRLSGFPQTAMRNDRLSAIEQWDLSGDAAAANEVAKGLATLASGEATEGPARFAGGEGRHGSFGKGTGPKNRRSSQPDGRSLAVLTMLLSKSETPSHGHSLRRLRLSRHPLRALEILEAGDHGAESRLGDRRVEALRRRVGAHLRDDGVDPGGIADGGRILLEPPRFAHVLLPLGHQAHEIVVDAVDVLADLGQRRAAFAAVGRRAPPIGRPRRRVVGLRGKRDEGGRRRGGILRTMGKPAAGSGIG